MTITANVVEAEYRLASSEQLARVRSVAALELALQARGFSEDGAEDAGVTIERAKKFLEFIG